MRRKLNFVSLLLSVVLVLCGVASAEPLPYPVGMIQGPPGFTSFTEAPYAHPPGCNLIVLQPDGSIETLVVGSRPELGLVSVAEWVEDFDCEHIYYTHHHAAGGSSLWKLDLDSGERVQLTPTVAGQYDCAPCVCPNGRILFTSSRDRIRQMKSDQLAMRVYAMDTDGKNVEIVWPAALGGALHPSIKRNGKVTFSHGEQQGLRRTVWNILEINPDGGDFGPLVSALGPGSADWHFYACTSSGWDILGRYYDTQWAGGLLGAPDMAGVQFGPPTNFGNPDPTKNPPIPHKNYKDRFAFQRHNLLNLLTEQTWQDVVPAVVDGQSVGTSTHPAACPDNGLLMTWRRGPKSASTDPTKGTVGVYYVADASRSHLTSELVPVLDDPLLLECYARPLVKYRAVHGIDAPPVRESERDPYLPEASPFAVVGTSSIEYRESETNGDLQAQGGDKGVDTDAIEYIGIMLTKPNSYDHPTRLPPMAAVRSGTGLSGRDGYGNEFMERVALYDLLIPLTKWRMPDGSIEYGPEQPVGGEMILHGDERDTSFEAEIPANQPFTFSYLDADGVQLGMAPTWHNLPPGNRNHDCGGCHAHWKPAPFPFEDSFAATSEYTRVRLTKARPVVEYWTDVRPIFDARGVVDAAGAPHTRQTLYAAGNKDFLAAASPIITAMRGGAYPGMTDAEIKLVADWIATGMTEAGLESSGGPRLTPATMRGPWADTNPPTLVVVPERRPDAPVSEIVIGAADPDSGLNVESLSVVADFEVNGRAPGEELADMFIQATDDVSFISPMPAGTHYTNARWLLDDLPPVTSGTLTVSIRDNQQARKVDGTPLGEPGNLTRIVRSFAVEDTAAELAALYARRDELLEEIEELTAAYQAAVAPLAAELEEVNERIAEIEGE